MLQQIIENEDAVAFLRAQIAAREQAAEPPPGRTIARIGENVRRAVGEDEARAGVIGERQFLLAFDQMGAHHAGNRVAIAEPETVEPDMRRLQHQLLGMRGAAQEGEVGGDGEFEIAGHVTHTSRAGTNAAWAGRRHVAVEPGAKQPEAQSGFVLDAEIVARGAAVLAPPGAFDAFGPFGGNHFVQGAAPAETHRRAVGHEREDVRDRLGLGEQTQRPRAQSDIGAEAAERIPAELGSRRGLRRHGCGGEFGDVAVIARPDGTHAAGPSRALRRSTRRSSSA